MNILIKYAYRAICLAVALFLFIPAQAFSEDPGIADGDWYIYRIMAADDKPQSKFSITSDKHKPVIVKSRLTTDQLDGNKVYVLDRVEITKETDRIHSKFILDYNDQSIIEISKQVTSRTGKLVRTSYITYQDPMFKNPGRVSYFYAIVPVVQLMDLKVGAKDSIELMLGYDSPPWKADFEVENIETITVPAGTFECYHIVFNFDVEQIMGNWAFGAKIIKKLAPTFHLWLDTEHPHSIVKCKGALGLKGTVPQNNIELIRIDQPHS